MPLPAFDNPRRTSARLALALIATGAGLAGCGTTPPASPDNHLAAANGSFFPKDPAKPLTALESENLAYAVQTCREFAWARETPREIFLNDVLPPDFVDEEQRSWRPEMYKRFAPIARPCSTRREAILLIAKKAADTCAVKYSTARRSANQCVAESLETGTASCTGLSILLAAAYRSVGIPARLAGVAEWGDRPGNHTWVEVWDTDGWHFVEYYPDEKGLDHGWILEPVSKLDPKNPASRVIARTRTGGDTIYRLPWDPARTDLRGVDRTAAYQKLSGVAVVAPKPGEGLAAFESADAAGNRIVVSFRVLDGDREIFSGKTPGPLDDLNNAPRVALKLKHGYTVAYAGKDGKPRTFPVEVNACELSRIVLPAE